MSIDADDIKQFIVHEESLDPSEIEVHTALFSAGLLDSFSMVSLVSFLEKKAGLRVKPTEVTLENFDSIQLMLKFLETR